MKVNNKLREALEKLTKAVQDWFNGGELLSPMADALELAKAALAEPPRNCDVGTPDDVAKAWHAHHIVCEGCVFKRGKACAPGGTCSIGWLLAPATKQEGGAK